MAAIAGSLALPYASAKSGMPGKMEPKEFKEANEKGGKDVKAVSPDSGKLSASDTKLLQEMAMGGMMQLELSQVAVRMASSDDVKMIAKAEVEEQTILSAKLKEIATSGGGTIPGEPDDKTTKAVEMLKGKSGAEFDKAYLKSSGIEGHEMLLSTMEKVSEKAESTALKGVAKAALPLIKVHLQVSKDESSEMA